MTKFLKLLLVLLFLMQLLVSSGFELAHDEAYYWLYSHDLDWGYFDHPPMVGLIIRLFSFLPHSELNVRMGFIILQFLSLFALFPLIDKKDRLNATLLYFAFPLASFAGLLALPDMPLVFMTSLYCLTLNRFLKNNDYASAMALGVIIPLLLYSKYHGILLILFTLMALPRLFLNKKFYLIAAISLLLFLPHVYWQYQHDFATLRYHFLERPGSDFSLKRSLEFLGIQVVLAGALAGPLVWWSAYQRTSQDSFTRVMKFISFGTVIFFLISSFTKRVEANWTIFLAIPLVYLTASSRWWESRVGKGLLYCSFAFVILTRLLFILPPEEIKIKRLKEFHGWKQWSQEMDKRCDGQLMANSYQIASKLSFYLQQDIHSLNYHSRKNQFDYWRFDRRIPINKVCYITDKAQFTGEPIITPEGKHLKLVKHLSYPELLQRKQEDMR
jgi:hypothetical protein